MHTPRPERSLTLLPASGVHARGSDIAAELRYLVRSPEPAVVFSSLAHLCVPTFSDACTVDIVEQGRLAYRIAYYRCDLDLADISSIEGSDWSVSTPFTSTGTGHADGSYVGVMTHRWRFRRPTIADRARAATLARHGVGTVTEEQRSDDPRHGPDTVEQLHAAFVDGDAVDGADVGVPRSVQPVVKV